MFRYSEYANEKMWSFKHSSKDALIQLIKISFEQNNIIFDRDKISKAIDRQSKIFVKPKKPGLAEVARGAAALIKNLSGISVSSQEITRRAKICASCPLVDSIGGCSSCGAAGKITQWANQIRAKRKLQIEIPQEIKSKFCGFCNCALALMVMTRREDFESESNEKNGMRPDNCWLKKTSTNFTNE